MSRALLVAVREYRQIAATRGFWVMLLVVPLAITISITAARFLGPPPSVAYVIVDAGGHYAPAIEHRIELEYQRQALIDLSAYARRRDVQSADPGAVWARGQGWFSDPQVEAFVAAGGVDAALRRIGPRLPAGAPVFAPKPRPFIRTPPPRDAPAGQGPDRFGAALGPYLQHGVDTPAGKRPLSLAVYVPDGFGAPGAVVRMWTDGRTNPLLIDAVRSELTRAMRTQAMQAGGVPPGTAEGIESLSAPLQVIQPTSGGGREQVFIRSAVPLALVYLLLITAISTGSMMLQGVIEERSNKLLEAVLACIRPGELMYGKLLGLGAVGLTIVAVWLGGGIGAAFSVQGVAADVLRPSLSALNQPWMIGALLFYFLTGYLIVSMIFLAIGSLSNSMQDAQAYLTPVLMLFMLPVIFMMNSALMNPDGPLPHILSWVPIYTPFAMLARLGGGVSMTEVLSTGAMVIVFVAVEILLLGRVFQASLLSAGQPPKLSGFIRLMFQSPSGRA